MVLRKSRNSLLLYWQKRHLGNLKKLLKLYGHLRRQSPARPRKHYVQAQARHPFCMFFFGCGQKQKSIFCGNILIDKVGSERGSCNR